MAEPRKIARYGWRPDLPDPRDRLYNNEAQIGFGHQLPQSVDLTAKMPPVYDQGQLGSCTANGAAALLEHQQIAQGEPAQTPSRLFIYYETRRMEGQPLDQDTGGEVRDAIKVLATAGAPIEPEWPYSDAQPGPFSEQPPQQAYIDAVTHESLVYRRITIGMPGAPMRSALAAGLPIVFGFSVPDYFEDPAWRADREPLPLPSPNTQFIGGHCVVIAGYDYTRTEFRENVFKIRNSWGTSFGEDGHFFMPSSWFDPWRGLATDFWTVSKVK